VYKLEVIDAVWITFMTDVYKDSSSTEQHVNN